MTPSIPQITYISLHYTHTKATWNSDSPLLEKIVRVTSALFSETFVNLWNALQNLVTWCRYTMTPKVDPTQPSVASIQTVAVASTNVAPTVVEDLDLPTPVARTSETPSASVQSVDLKTELLSLLAADRLDVARIHNLMNTGQSLDDSPGVVASLPIEETFQADLTEAIQGTSLLRGLSKLIQSTVHFIQQQQSQENPISQKLATQALICICHRWAADKYVPKQTLREELQYVLGESDEDLKELFINSAEKAIRQAFPEDSSRTKYSIPQDTVGELLQDYIEEPEFTQASKTLWTKLIRMNWLEFNYQNYNNHKALFDEISEETLTCLNQHIMNTQPTQEMS